jgi:hypothetical protein
MEGYGLMITLVGKGSGLLLAIRLLNRKEGVYVQNKTIRKRFGLMTREIV